MHKQMQDHEKYIRSCLDAKEEQDWELLLSYHQTQIGFLQHERFVHLMVTMVFAVFLVTFFIAGMALDSLGMLAIAVILIPVDIFYVLHYYKLENGVQRWYQLYKEIYGRR